MTGRWALRPVFRRIRLAAFPHNLIVGAETIRSLALDDSPDPAATPVKSASDPSSATPASVLREEGIEYGFIGKLQGLKYEYRPDIRDRAALKATFRHKFEVLSRVTTHRLVPEQPLCGVPSERLGIGISVSRVAPWAGMHCSVGASNRAD